MYFKGLHLSIGSTQSELEVQLPIFGVTPLYQKYSPPMFLSRRFIRYTCIFGYCYPSRPSIDETRVLMRHSTLLPLEGSLPDFVSFSWPHSKNKYALLVICAQRRRMSTDAFPENRKGFVTAVCSDIRRPRSLRQTLHWPSRVYPSMSVCRILCAERPAPERSRCKKCL